MNTDEVLAKSRKHSTQGSSPEPEPPTPKSGRGGAQLFYRTVVSDFCKASGKTSFTRVAEVVRLQTEVSRLRLQIRHLLPLA